MKKFITFLAMLALCATIILALRGKPNNDILFQTSTLDALLEGVYDGDLSFEELSKHGDFGLGTFNGLYGEMLALDDNFYRIKADGSVEHITDLKQKTPFSTVTHFEIDKTVELENIISIADLKTRLDSILGTKNIFYAIRIEGEFDYIKTRSVPKQQRPYPKLLEVLKTQPIFEFENVKGTIVGFRCPYYVKSVSVPGYHFHFITEDRKGGGHLLECRSESLKVGIDDTTGFTLDLPETDGFDSFSVQSGKDFSNKMFQGHSDKRDS